MLEICHKSNTTYRYQPAAISQNQDSPAGIRDKTPGTIVLPQIIAVIIQQIVTLSKYGHDALDICHP